MPASASRTPSRSATAPPRATSRWPQIARRQAGTLVAQVTQRVGTEVRNALAALDTAAQRIQAAQAGREAAVVQLQAEQDRFDAGLTTSFFVLTRQNDLAQAELAEIAARADYSRARAEYLRATGTLLGERGVSLDVTLTPASFVTALRFPRSCRRWTLTWPSPSLDGVTLKATAHLSRRARHRPPSRICRPAPPPAGHRLRRRARAFFPVTTLRARPCDSCLVSFAGHTARR